MRTRPPSHFLVSLGGLALAAAMLVQSGGYDLTWNSVDGGGGSLAAGGYSVSATIGQPDAGVLSGGAYTLQGGFWSALPGVRVLLPLVTR